MVNLLENCHVRRTHPRRLERNNLALDRVHATLHSRARRSYDTMRATSNTLAGTRTRVSSIVERAQRRDVARRAPLRAVSEPSSLETFAGAWYGPDMQTRSSEWTIELSDDHIREIDAALALARSRGYEIVELSPENFLLETLGPELERMGRELVHGRGFALMRNFPVERYTRWESCAAFFAMGRYMGFVVPQNKFGHVVGHVKNLGADPASPLTRLYTTNAAQPYHTDSADIVGLLCLSQALEGGHSQVTSSTAIWNELVKQSPQSAALLREPFVVSRKGEIPPGKEATYRIPIFHTTPDGRLCAIYDRSFIDSAKALVGATLSDEQTRALDDLDALACSDELRLDMTLQPGDIQWLHNHTILHARSAFTDRTDGEPRHLVRLWVSPDERVGAMQLPDIFAERFGTVAPGPSRGGIRVDGQGASCPLDAQQS